MMCFLRRAVCGIAFTLCANVAALPVTIDFETFTDSEVLTNQVPGLAFSGGTVLTAGISLNVFEFPPRSGVNVIFDDGGPLEIDFAIPVASIFAYLTYLEPVTLTVYDAASIEVGSVTSAFLTNTALSGDIGSSPNEPFSAIFAGGISRAVFMGNAAGSSFTLDDLTLTSVPEPSTVALLLLALAALLPRLRSVRR